jgi:hypothetical protein
LNALGAFVFLTPWGALVAVAVVLPIAAGVIASTRHARLRAVLDLRPPDGRKSAEVLSLVAVPLLVALAAAGPAIRSPSGHATLDNTEVIFVFDVSRSMAAAAGRHAPTRLAQAKAAALELRDAVPDAPAGVASLTTQLLPELFPTPNDAVFAGTVERALGVLKPPPPAFQVVATTFDPLAALRDQGFFSPDSSHRVAVLLTDGESTTFFPQNVGERLAGSLPTPSLFGQLQQQQPRQTQAPVELLVVRFGGKNDRVYRQDGSIDPGYRPDLRAAAIVAELTEAAHGGAFDASQLGAARKALRAAVGSSPRSTQTRTTKTTRLALYAALVALLPLGFLVWRRNVVDL